MPDEEPLPRPALGASTEALTPTDQVQPVASESLGTGANPLLALRRLDRGFVQPDDLLSVFPRGTLLRLGLEDAPRGGGRAEAPKTGAPSSVDWCARWGQNWITRARDQHPCNAGWAFAGTALVEAMVRIEHGIWTCLSEGDVHDGLGKKCADLGDAGEVSAHFESIGLCGPGSWPWQSGDVLYAPTADRNGRTVRGPAFETVSVADSKDWLDTVGPLVGYIDVYRDLGGLRGGVYQRSTDPANSLRGGQLLLIVGYDDGLGAWLCKNSWGTCWGSNGFGWIAYGQCNIDSYARSGLRATDPDPWTKRRLHNGNLFESGNGAMHSNLEVLSADGSRILHRWREGGPPFTWETAGTFATDAATLPTLVGTTFDRSMEAVYRTPNGRLRHWWTAGDGGGPWNDGGVFGPGDCTGVPGFVQSDHNAPGNFEVVVSIVTNRLQHVWRAGGAWHNGAVFGNNILSSGPTLVQSTFGTPHGSLVCVAVRTDGTMQQFARDESTSAWSPGTVFGRGISSPPAMIQGQYGMHDELGPHGNFELCVAVGGRVQHWWRGNADDQQWRHSADFGHDVRAVAGLCQSSWGMNLEVIAVRTDDQLQHYWRDGSGWHEGPVIGPL